MKVRKESGCWENKGFFKENAWIYRLASHQIYQVKALQQVFEGFFVVFHGEIEEAQVRDRLHGVVVVQTVELFQGVQALLLV